jgi:hypothetical protein
VVVSATLALPMAAFAQNVDLKYCKSLSDKYREYARADTVDSEAAAAMAQCDTNAAAAIPVIEKHLKADKVTLPPRS